MKKLEKHLGYSLSRYAPESFCAYIRYHHDGKDARLDIPLSADEKYWLGYTCIRDGKPAMIKQLLPIVRRWLRSPQLKHAVGFRLDTGEILFCRGLYFSPYDIQSALRVYKETKLDFEEHGWKHEIGTTAKLDGRYQPIQGSMKKSYANILKEQPVLMKLCKS